MRCPVCGTESTAVDPARKEQEPKVRPFRRLRGDYDEAAINEVARIPGVGRARAEELCRAGYTSASKLKEATEEDLAKVVAVGVGGAKVIKDSLQFVAVVPQKWTKEQAMAEEHACPLCGCVTSMFAERCHECGAEFEEAELDDHLRAELKHMGAKAELAFYEIRLMEDRSDPALWYARGRLVLEMGNVPEALASWHNALQLRPGDARVLLARALALYGLNEVGRAAKHFRAAVSDLLHEPKRDVEKPGNEAEAGTAPSVAHPSGLGVRSCPSCGESAPKGAAACPSCRRPLSPMPAGESAQPEGAAEVSTEVFRSLEELESLVAPSRAEVVSPGEPLERVTAGPPPLEGPTGAFPQGAQGRTRRGLVNGQGLINGRGRVNGLMNRDGFVNGAELTQVRPMRSVPFTRYGLVAVALAMSALVVILTVPPPGPSGPRIVIDGGIADWSGLPGFQDVVPNPNPDIALRSYAILGENGSMSIRLSVAGTALGDPLGIDAFYVFFDADGDAGTGYVVHGLGAEGFLSVDGGNGSVVNAAVHTWPSTSTDRYNWSGFARVHDAIAAVRGPTLEAQFPTDELLLAPGFRALFIANDFEGHEAVATVAIGSTPAALLVTQSTAPAAGVVAAPGDALLRLTFEAFGGPVTVADVRLGPAGNGTLGSPPLPPPLSPGTPTSVDVPIAFTPTEAGGLASARVASIIADAAVTIRGPPATAYLQGAPGGYRIDGHFGEWNATATDGDPVPVANAHVDINRFGTGLAGTSTIVYADTVGDVLRGRATPEVRRRPVPGAPSTSQGAPGVPARRSGEDLFRAFIDPDSRDANGTPVLGISAEFLLEVRGVHGRITSMTSYEWVGSWQRTSRAVEAANDRRQIEASIDLSGILLFDPEVVLEAMDWDNGGDSTDPAVSRVSGVQVRVPQAPGFEVLGNPAGARLLLAVALGGGQLLVDGVCTDAGYSGAGTSSQANLTIKAGTRANFVWICIEALFDTSNDASDTGYVYFDRDDSGGSVPTAGDRRFSAIGGSIGGSIGGGGDWVGCTFAGNPGPTECDNQDMAAAGFLTIRRYEFKIHMTDVWNTSSPSPNQRAGFAVRLVDASNGTLYKWGSTSVDVTSTDLNTWGHLDIPELGEFGSWAATAAVLGFGFVGHRTFRRRRLRADPP